jgi:hypothetical protein
MVLKAVGLYSTGRLNKLFTWIGLWFLRRKSAQLAATAS